HEDPSIAMAGHVGSQIKMLVGQCWVVATVRTLSIDPRVPQHVVADIDFVGEGDQEQLTGRIFRFRRGVTRFPVPGTPVFPVAQADMLEIYAAHDEASIEIGTVYPTVDTRASLL